MLSPVDHPMLAAARQHPKRDGGLHSFLESFTNICTPFRCIPTSDPYREVSSTKVVYPVEKFSDYAALDAASLIQQRRADMRHRLFRPVSEDDESLFHSQVNQTYAM